MNIINSPSLNDQEGEDLTSAYRKVKSYASYFQEAVQPKSMVLVELILVSGICINSATPPKIGYLHDFTEMLYLFSLAAITKHHTLSGLKKIRHLFSLSSGRLEIEIKVSVGPGSLQRLHRRILPRLRPASGDFQRSLLLTGL